MCARERDRGGRERDEKERGMRDERDMRKRQRGEREGERELYIETALWPIGAPMFQTIIC